jgi:hypothetical protein
MKNFKILFRSKKLDQEIKFAGIDYLGNEIPAIIKKRPTKSQIEKYFLNIIKTNSYLISTDSSINPLRNMIHEVWSKHFKNIPFSKHNLFTSRFFKVLESYNYKEVEKLLKKYCLMPQYFYGLHKNRKKYFFNFMFTDIQYVNFEKDIFVFKMFNSDELISIFNSSYFEGIILPREVYISEEGQLLICPPFKKEYVLLTKDFSAFELDKVYDTFDEASVLNLFTLSEYKHSDKFEVEEVDMNISVFDDYVIPTTIQI